MSIKILCLEDKRIDAVGYWRVYQPFQVMRKLYPGVFDIEYRKEGLTYADIANFDIIFMTRPEKPDHIEFIKNAKLHGMGTKFICDCDDDYFDLPTAHAMTAGFNKDRRKRLEVTQSIWSLADVMWFSTDYLTNKYGPKVRKAMTIPNAVLPEILPDEPAPDQGRIVWRGHSIQAHDLMLQGKKQYQQLLDFFEYFAWVGYFPPFPGWEKVIQFPEGNKQARAELYGAKNKFGETPVVLYPPVANTADYMLMLQVDKFNAVWKPLLDHGFNYAKSNIAWIEATVGGGYCITNFAGKNQWEFASAEPLPYSEACDLWAKSKAEIKANYNLISTANMRAQSIFEVLGVNIKQSAA